MINPKIFQLVLLSSVGFTAWAFPFGAGSCPVGTPAVGETHVRQGNLDVDLDIGDSPYNFTLSLDNVLVDMQGRMTQFGIGRDHELVLESHKGQFKGLLIRLGPAPDRSEYVTDFTGSLDVLPGDPDYRLAIEHCIETEKVGGITHQYNNTKSRAAVTLRMDEPASDLWMDITVVIQNNADRSEFYHSVFSFEAVDTDNPSNTGNDQSAGRRRINHFMFMGVTSILIAVLLSLSTFM